MKKILFLVVVLLSVVSAKLYSSNQELVFQEIRCKILLKVVNVTPKQTVFISRHLWSLSQ